MEENSGHRDLIVIGASAGGVEALQALFSRLPHRLGAALLVVLHIGARHSVLPEVLGRAGKRPVAWAGDGELIRAGRAYVAPPNRHLLLARDGGHLRLSRGPLENRTRPAIDPLFRSAAEVAGPRVVGVVLSGALSDGTVGLAAIARQGGITVVQDPEEAQYPDMPRSALRYVPVHHRLKVAGIAALLGQVCGPGHSPPGQTRPFGHEEANRMGNDRLKRPVELTCPNCGGAVRQRLVDGMPYFECHIGHRLAAADMDEAQFQQVESALDVALRVLNERSELCRRLAEAARGRNHTLSADRWDRAMWESQDRAEVLRRFVEQGWQRPSDDGEPPPATG